MKVIGYKEMDFSAQDGTHIKGYKVFCTFDDDKAVGSACESFFVSEKKAAGWVPEIGEEIEIVYNKYGKIDRVEAA